MAAVSSPMQFDTRTTQQLMQLVLMATIPGILIFTWFFGYGLMLNIVVAAAFAVAAEILALAVQARPVRPALADYSVLVTALLFALAVPPGAAWWLIAAGMLFAVALVKHAYGGLGQNPFNPAMAGYLFLLLAFPLDMTTWHLPEAAITPDSDGSPLGWAALLQSLSALLQWPGTTASIDGLAMATPLIEFKLSANSALLEAIQTGQSIFARSAGTGWELVNIAYLLGGLFLLAQRVIAWHIPFSIILTVLGLSMLFYSPGAAAVMGTPYLHLFGSATMLGAFFIATDPVSAATSNPARIVYGILIGCSIYTIRVWGSYLDSIAIAVLFGNFCAPALDFYLRPRIFGHGRKALRAKRPEQS